MNRQRRPFASRGESGCVRRQRSGLDRRLLVVEDDLVNLVEREAGDLDRRVAEK
jgi:hypothetical protein